MPVLPFRRSRSLFVLSLLSLTVTACQAPPLAPVAGASATPSPNPSASVSPSALPSAASPSPTPLASAGVSPSPAVSPGPGGGTTTLTLPDGTRLVLTLSSRFLTAQGQSAQVSARLEDAAGQPLPFDPLRLIYTSSRPQDISVTPQGLITALTNDGFSLVTVRLEGTDISASQQISVNSLTSGGSSGGGGGGGGGSPTPTPTPLENLNVSLGFEGLGRGEFRVSTDPARSEITPAVASDAVGNLVIVSQSEGGEGFDPNIYAQLYHSSGRPNGPEFRVNTYTSNTQRHPQVAMSAEGDFVVVWESFGQDGDAYGVFAQRYNAAGVPQGEELQINQQATSQQTHAAVAMDDAGDFVVAWQSLAADGDGYGIMARAYTAAGEPVDDAIQVNTSTTGAQINPVLASDGAGDFVVAWQNGENDTSSTDVLMRRYTSQAVPLGGEIAVHSYTTGSQDRPDIAMNSDGDFVVAWQSADQDGSGQGIYAQRYSSAGSAAGSAFRVNTYTTGNQASPAVAIDAAGDFLLSWNSFAQDGSKYGVYAQRYNAQGTPQGDEFRANSTTFSNEMNSDVVLDADGDFAIVWQSSNLGPDGSQVYAKRYQSNGQAR
ncbi:MAG: hypothetical protein ACO1RX_19805 [Candidatus Sericytochromatia bacterium]